ncbi:molybdopterin-synthase adenylyltransferase MoeB [Rubrivirga sp. S365]|uniref:molybdopterin-synthase adenylyltransferase MoeB n=1 Tax=Rubrivirga sp. S365 TaxID=3076080 RepID=UPI0028C7F573|nr:molybdopterin-synthase adenylyltransferase MoeB [Rubrivirga sp. S365]MDT7857153.1 molybdopterin-synthase adenylyltransferase MoeB [Rubrivirga sp. S365]
MEIQTSARYHRQVLLPEVGLKGQERLGAASVLIVGAGGLGTPAATYLAAAGVGRLGLIDFDRVDETNLHRQVLYTPEDVGEAKVDVIAQRLTAQNPEVEVVRHASRLDASNALDLVGAYDLVLDGTDTFTTRYLVNDASVLTGTPNVFASISRFDGQASVFGAPGGPCYRCLFPAPPPAGLVPNCAEGGVLGVLPGLLGTIQATEALKLLLGIGDPLVGRLLLVDALNMVFRELRVDPDPACPVCGDHPTLTHLTPTQPMASVPETTVRDLKTRIDAGDRPFILDVREADEYEGANIGGALIPLGELPDRIDEIREHQNEDVVVHCRSGGRSAKAVEYLRANGFPNAVNLKGGIHAWSDEVDPSLPKV